MKKTKNGLTFSPAMDKHRKLKGKQSKLPDEIQKKIIESGNEKVSALKQPKAKFTPAMDNHPSLKGGQKGLPDQLQKQIIKSHQKKTAALTDMEEALVSSYMASPAFGAGASVLGYLQAKKKLKALGMSDDEIEEELEGNALNAAMRGGAMGFAGMGIAGEHLPESNTRLGALYRGGVPLLSSVAAHSYEKSQGRKAARAYKKSMQKEAGHMTGGLEGRMARRKLLEIMEMSEELFNQINDHDDLPEWCQSKIATIHDRLHSVHSYMSYNERFPQSHPTIIGRLMPKVASQDCGCGCNDCDGQTKVAGVKKEYQNPEGGLNAKGRAYFKRTQGSNLKRPVSARQASKSPKAAGRRRSFCSRMGGMKRKHGIDCSKDPNKSICKALRKWDC